MSSAAFQWTGPAATLPTGERVDQVSSTVVLALARQQDHHLEPFRNKLSCPLVVDSSWRPAVFDRFDVGLLLVLCGDVWDLDVCLREARERRIPSLLLMDGILEYKNQWTHPRYAAGGGAPFLTPVQADKVACLGWLDRRRLESWGNHGKCEIVGLPRLDRYLTARPRRRDKTAKPRILVASANTPWFNDGQRRPTIQSYEDLAAAAASLPEIEFVWRVRKGLLPIVEGRQSPLDSSQPLADVLSQVDAVITQPSTLQLEAMLCGLPVAVLDYVNVPAFVPSAWRISAPGHIMPVIDAITNPELTRMAFQEECLHNTLACRSPAAGRIVCLMEKMVQLGADARKAGVEIEFPDEMLPVDRSLPLSTHLNLRCQYKEHPTFGRTDLLDLQRRLAMAELELRRAREVMERRTIGFWMERAIRRIHAGWRNRGFARA